ICKQTDPRARSDTAPARAVGCPAGFRGGDGTGERRSSKPVATPGKFEFDFSKYPESGLVIIIVVLGLVLAVFGGSVQMPRFETTPEGKRQRALVTNTEGQQVPAF